jgi:hypothetical protein
MSVWQLDRAVILARLIVWLIFVAGILKTAVPNRIRRLYSARVNLLTIVPFSTRWQKEIAPEHVDAYRRSRRWYFVGMTALLAVPLLQFTYFKFFFMRVHGFDLYEKNMSLHTQYTSLRPENDADKARAVTLVTDLQHALAKYGDYHVAEAEGFMPPDHELKVPVVLFTKNCRGPRAPVAFNPSEPTWLLYQPTPNGGYKLIGATYIDEEDTSEDQLNQRVPLSVARWHRDVNLCLPARGTKIKTADLTKFFSDGSIATKQACDAAGGRFSSSLPGWTIEVHPWEQNLSLVWRQ